MNPKSGNWLKIGLGVVLASTLTACGGAAVVRQHSSATKATPKATASVSPTPSGNGLTLAAVNALNYKVHFPTIPCQTLPNYTQEEWGPLLMGSSVGVCAPPNFIASEVPAHIQVINDDPAISQAQANAYGEAYAVTQAWMWWAYENDALGVLSAVGIQGGSMEQVIRGMQNGYRVYGALPGYVVFFNKMYLVPLNSAGQTAMGGATENFALIETEVQHSSTATIRMNSSQTPHAVTSPPSPPGIVSGRIANNPVLGQVFVVTNLSDNCTTGATASICAEAGIS